MERIQIEISESPIDLSRELERLQDSAHGAETIFIGKVRETNLGRRVMAVAYDCFAPLAEAVLLQIAEEARAKWGRELRVAILHRTGTLLIGEISVVIAVSAVHRGEAYEASRYLIEELKKRAPIWKKETYEDGESEWLQGHALCGHSHEALP